MDPMGIKKPGFFTSLRFHLNGESPSSPVGPQVALRSLDRDERFCAVRGLEQEAKADFFRKTGGQRICGYDTPWKINMEHTNHPFRKENDLNQTSMMKCSSR